MRSRRKCKLATRLDSPLAQPPNLSGGVTGHGRGASGRGSSSPDRHRRRPSATRPCSSPTPTWSARATATAATRWTRQRAVARTGVESVSRSSVSEPDRSSTASRSAAGERGRHRVRGPFAARRSPPCQSGFAITWMVRVGWLSMRMTVLPKCSVSRPGWRLASSVTLDTGPTSRVTRVVPEASTSSLMNRC